MSSGTPSFSVPALSKDNIESLSDLLVKIRRHLHQHPELGMKEHATSQYIRETLEQFGLNVQGPIAKTGLYVDIEGEKTGRGVGYRADIDALPTQDAKEVGYHSVNEGIAHLCGHDAHTAIGIGVALLLDRHRDALSGKARVFFQPNEEGSKHSPSSGAPLMIEEGVLDGLDAVYAIHVDPTLHAGRYGLVTGPVTAASDRFDVRVRGEGTSHSSRPHQTVDTVWVATQIANSLYQLAGRITDARNATVLTICRFRAGEAYNVIPAEVSFGGTLRTTSAEDRLFLRRRIEEIAQQQGALYGARVEVKIDPGSPPAVNAPGPVRIVEETIRQDFGEDAIFKIPRPSMGAEDFAHYLERVPGALIRVGTASGPATSHPLHNARFDLDESVLAPTARLMSRVLISYLRG